MLFVNDSIFCLSARVGYTCKNMCDRTCVLYMCGCVDQTDPSFQTAYAISITKSKTHIIFN